MIRRSAHSPIASSVPGRLRLRHAALRETACLENLRTAAGGWHGVREVEANARVGSLLVHYDAALIPQAELEVRLLGAAGLAAANDALAEPLPAKAPAAAGRRLNRVAVNRQAKRAMLASLGVSLALAAAGAKRWHVLTGGMFLASLLVHLTVHRRHLLR